jgi:hypothetical protein
MTTLGAIEGVGRTRYVDEVENVNVYPLDAKIELLEIDGRYSRYTGNFSRLAAEYYARMPERDALSLLDRTLKIDLKLDSLTYIGAAVAQPYLQKLCDETEGEDAPQQITANETGFIAQRIQEIDASPDRDAIILKALNDGAEGTQRKDTAPDLTVAYVEADGTGVSGLPKELSDKGKNGGPAKTFEAKVGVAFKQSFDSGGLPLLNNDGIFREPDSTKYMGTVEKISQFILMFAAFVRSCGVFCADQIVFLSDGAIWLEKLREKLFPNSIGIVDLYHALQHLHKLIALLRFHSNSRKNEFFKKCSHFLNLGDIDRMIALISSKIIDSNRESVEKQLEYFERNKDKMRYGLFRAAGLFIGSGVVESACKTLVENRLNGSGMRWSKKNAANVIALRSAIYSGSFDYAA